MVELQPFRYWVQNVLPQVYDDSLSYYELLGKVVWYINGLVENTNELAEENVQLSAAIKELQDYFESADFQQMLDDKLDEMVEDGTFDTIIENVMQEYLDSHIIYTPEAFGAKGDGQTDDTAAINSMFNIVRRGVVAFRANHKYLISDTVVIRGGSETLNVILGSLEYIGGQNDDKPMIKFLKTTGGNIKLYGGELDCNRLAGIGIQNYDCFACVIDGVTIVKYRNVAIMNGAPELLDVEGGLHSVQLTVANCTASNYNFSDDHTAVKGIGLYLIHPEANIVNCNFNVCEVGVKLVKGGNYISNCHFTLTSEKPTQQSDLAYDFIQVCPQYSGTNEVNIFDTCYFNGYKMRNLVRNTYLTENDTPAAVQLVTRICDCNLILGGPDVDVKSYIFGKTYCPVQIDNLCVRHGSHETMVGAMQVGSGADSVQKNTLSVQTAISHNSNPFDIVNFSNTPAIISGSSGPLIAGKLRRIARVFVNPAWESSAKVNVFNASFNVDIILQYRSTGMNCFKITKYNTLDDDLKFYVDASSTVSSNDPSSPNYTGELTLRWFDIYIYNNSANDIERRMFIRTDNDNYPLSQIAVFTGLDGSGDIASPTLSNYKYINEKIVSACSFAGCKALIIGSSWAGGYTGSGGSTANPTWPDKLIDLLDLSSKSIKVKQYSGGLYQRGNASSTYPSENYLEVMQNHFRDEPCDLIIFQGGANDIVNASTEGLLQNVIDLKTECNTYHSGIPVYYIPTYGNMLIDRTYLDRAHSFVQALRDRGFVVPKNSLNWFTGRDTLMGTDTVHLSEAGYGIFANMVAGFMLGCDGYDYPKYTNTKTTADPPDFLSGIAVGSNEDVSVGSWFVRYKNGKVNVQGTVTILSTSSGSSNNITIMTGLPVPLFAGFRAVVTSYTATKPIPIIQISEAGNLVLTGNTSSYADQAFSFSLIYETLQSVD